MRPTTCLSPFWLVILVLPPVVALAALPPFGQRMVILAGIYGLMGLGYQLVFGQLGALNLAQGALFGLGAYAAALTAPILGPFALPVAILAAAIPAALVAGPLLRLQSHYFALATLALASLVMEAARRTGEGRELGELCILKAAQNGATTPTARKMMLS